MTPADYYANEGYDMAGELLCTAPEHPPVAVMPGVVPNAVSAPMAVRTTREVATDGTVTEYGWDGQSTAPIWTRTSKPSALFTFAAAFTREYSQHLPPALPPTA